MSTVLAICLMVRVAMFPDMVPIQMGAYETEKDCLRAAAELDNSTLVILDLRCEVRS